MIRFSPNPNRARLINWLEWGPEAFEQAQRQDKLIMLFIGAFWCGFCQRMDETTFSIDETIALLNAYFVPIRVEDAQRPDINARYNQNGWPTIAFMTPQGDLLASVNYMPPNDFCDVLAQLYQHYEEHKDELKGEASEDIVQQTSAVAQSNPRPDAVSEISDTLMGMADTAYGGYGPDHKFLHPEAQAFLLNRYHATGDHAYLKHVALTLDRMLNSRTHDDEDGGFHRYSSKRDWSEPHQEKLLTDHAGLLKNNLHMFLITGDSRYKSMADEIIGFLNTRLSKDETPAFLGCQDYVRAVTRRVSEAEVTTPREPGSLYWVIDDWIYTDANAQAVSACLEAWWILGRQDCKDRALNTLEFLWEHCRNSEGLLCHCNDGQPNAPGLLIDKVRLGIALLDAYRYTDEPCHLERATDLADSIIESHSNPEGGYYDISIKGHAYLRFQLTLLTENGLAASFLLGMYDFTANGDYREAALSALGAFTDDFAPYGVYASDYGLALANYMVSPLQVTIEGNPGDATVRSLALATMDKLANHRLILKFCATQTPTETAVLYLQNEHAKVGPIYDAEKVTPELLASSRYSA